jgi:hypothetical protein
MAAAVLAAGCWPVPWLAAQDEPSASRAIDTASDNAVQLSTLHHQATELRDCRVRVAEDFVPMSDNERLVMAAKSVTTPAIFESVLEAGILEGIDRPKEWETHLDGFGKRLGNAYAERFIDESIEHSIAFGLHEDNRYFASGKSGVGRRLLYVLESTVMARHDDGSRSVSVSGIGGAAGAAFLSRAWQSRSTSSAGDGAVSFGLILATRAIRNGLYEFAPRVFGRFWQ